MTSRLTLPQQRAIETRLRILDAASRVFSRRGYGAASVSNIAAEAGISMGALYHHFASKEDLFRAILDDHIRADLREFAELPTSEGSFRALIDSVIRFWIENFQSHGELDPLFMEFWAQATREDWARAPVAAFFRTGRELTRDFLRISQQAGAVRPDLDLEAAATLLHATLHGLWVARAIDPREAEAPGLIDAFVDLIERFVGQAGVVDIEALGSRLAASADEHSRRGAESFEGSPHSEVPGASKDRETTGDRR